jgi:hypothetical protein
MRKHRIQQPLLPFFTDSALWKQFPLDRQDRCRLLLARLLAEWSKPKSKKGVPMNAEKIQLTHRERAAYVYVRQSSMQQVRHAQEGQKRQYALEPRAQALGFRQVVVIDEDLGKSGSGSVERPGFGQLLTAVCQGTVGAIFALESPRPHGHRGKNKSVSCVPAKRATGLPLRLTLPTLAMP